MKKMKFSRFLSLMLIVLMTAAMALTAASCGNNKNVLGKGKTTITVNVTDKEQKTETFTVKTDKEMLGEALQEVKLIEGDVTEYGLMVTKVNGKEAIYDVDGYYWALYINGEYAMTGVDSTPVTDGGVFDFKAEK